MSTAPPPDVPADDLARFPGSGEIDVSSLTPKDRRKLEKLRRYNEARGTPDSDVYVFFILLLTALSLVIMLCLLLPELADSTRRLLLFYDNLICYIFLYDFFTHLYRAPNKKAFFFTGRGWLDLLGSIPSFGLSQITPLLRLARLSRVVRITRLLRSRKHGTIVKNVIANRGQYASFITIMSTAIVLSISSALVLQFESHATDANITTPGDALFWAITTITTVGYGDLFPVTPAGRIVASLVMITGVGIIAALASILASVLIPQPSTEEVDDDLVVLRRQLDGISRRLDAVLGSSPTGADAGSPADSAGRPDGSSTDGRPGDEDAADPGTGPGSAPS